MKRALVSPRILSLTRDEGQWVVDEDYSQVASGTIPQQKQDGKCRLADRPLLADYYQKVRQSTAQLARSY